VQRCFNWGVERRLIPPHNLGRIPKPQPRRRDRFLTDAKFQALLRETNPRNGHRSGAPFRRFLLAMDLTLCRPSELAQLQWKHIRWEHDIAVLPDHKIKRTGKPKIIPIVPAMKRLLLWLKRRSTSDFCFVNSRGCPWTLSAIEQRMAHVARRTGLSDVVPYTLRHRAATSALLATGNLKMTSLLLGHTSTATTERYTHLAQEHLVKFAREAVGRRRRV
jgi:integrase